MAAWSRKTLKKFPEIFAFLEKRPFTVKFSKFCSESFNRDTHRRVVFKFREIWPTGNRWNRALLTWQKQISPGSPAVATVRMAPILPGPALDNVLKVIAERTKPAKTRRKVNPIFDWSLSSSRININRKTRLNRLNSKYNYKALTQVRSDHFFSCCDRELWPVTLTSLHDLDSITMIQHRQIHLTDRFSWSIIIIKSWHKYLHTSATAMTTE